MQDNFGGHYGPSANGPVRNQYTRVASLKKSMNAYMLVYLRKNKIGEILPPLTEKDTPAHLRKFSHNLRVVIKSNY